MQQESEKRTVLAKDRTHLANIRTFLSWIRTGLASAGGGLAIIRLLTFQDPLHQTMAEILGSVLVLLGMSIFILAFLDYRASCKRLYLKRAFAGSLGFSGLITFILAFVSLLLLIIAL